MTDTEKRDLGLAQQEFKKNYRYRVMKHNLITEVVTVVMVALLLISMTFVLSVASIRGNGMEPGISDGQHVIINKVAYMKRSPARGEVVSSGRRIYRIVALPGEHVEISGGKLFINGTRADEDYEDDSVFTYPGRARTYTVPDDSFFVLMDNRDCYDDSRTGTYIPTDSIDGKVIIHF